MALLHSGSDSAGPILAVSPQRCRPDHRAQLRLLALRQPAAADEQTRDARIRAGFMLVESDRSGLQAVAGLVNSGKLQINVNAVVPLEDAAKAHVLGETGRTTGKIVLSVALTRPPEGEAPAGAPSLTGPGPSCSRRSRSAHFYAANDGHEARRTPPFRTAQVCAMSTNRE
ncbi:zinc-binding dehydrogenase [Streptomyces sioyaensis]